MIELQAKQHIIFLSFPHSIANGNVRMSVAVRIRTMPFAAHTHEQAMKRRKKEIDNKNRHHLIRSRHEEGKMERKNSFHWTFHYVINAVIFIDRRKIFALKHAIQQYECECKWRNDVKFNTTQTCDPFIGTSNEFLFLSNRSLDPVCAELNRIRRNENEKQHSI